MASADTRKVAVRSGLAAIAAAGMVAVGLAAPANAQIISICSGTAQNATVYNDLIIRANDWCVLEDSTIQGDVKVRGGADLVTVNTNIDGRVIGGPDSYVSMEESTVTDRVILRDAFGLLAVDSELGENVAVRDAPNADIAPGAVQAIDSSIAGTLNAKIGAIWLGGSTVGANVFGDGVEYVDVHDTVVNRQLRVTNAAYGSVVCDSEVYGNVQYTDNTGPVQLGGDSDEAGCEGANYWHRGISVNGTDGMVHVADNIIRLGLTGEGNDPAPVGESNRVRGGADGQFADLAPAKSDMSRMSTMSTQRESIERGEELQDSFEDRRDDAVRKAERVGKANL